MERIRQKDENFYTLHKCIPELEPCIQKNVTSGIINIIEKIACDLQLLDPDETAAEIAFECQGLQEVKERLTKVLTSYIRNYLGLQYDINDF